MIKLDISETTGSQLCIFVTLSDGSISSYPPLELTVMIKLANLFRAFGSFPMA